MPEPTPRQIATANVRLLFDAITAAREGIEADRSNRSFQESYRDYKSRIAALGKFVYDHRAELFGDPSEESTK